MGASVSLLRLLRQRREGPHSCPAQRRAAELAAELSGMARSGRVYVRVGHVLETLDPERKLAPPAPPALPPDADPLTGCLPVAADPPGAERAT